MKTTKKAIIFDLDNTIYSAPSIGDELFASLLQLIIASGECSDNFSLVKHDIMRKPFQVVAATHQFSEALTGQGINLLKHLTYDKTIAPFPDYAATRLLAPEKFLVTTGFLLLQKSKIRNLNIEQDFKEIHIVDPLTSTHTKKDVFAAIIQRNGYAYPEVLVTGDDPHSEIKAAKELGIDVVLYDKFNLHGHHTALPRISDFGQLIHFL